MQIGTRRQIVIVGIVATGLAIGGFQMGRRSVDAAALSMRAAESRADSSSMPPRSGAMATSDHGDPRISEIATVPFSELYDVLHSASCEQLLAWARDLERMPRGPRQRAAIIAYYKSLIQVDHHAAIEALFHVENLNMRDLAINALLKAAPESIWAELAEMMEQLPYPGRGYSQEDLILNWSRVDPVATSQFIEKHPFNGEDRRLPSLLGNWGEIDPATARAWIEADSSRQTKDALRAFVTSWGRTDRAGAIDYAVANAHEPKFEGAINELVYQFVRSAKEDATRLISLLPPAQAKAAMKNVADITNPREIDPNLDRPPDYQRPPDEVARWMVGLPVEFWNESIGMVAQEWLARDAVSATAWFDQLPTNSRDAAITSFCRGAGGASAEHVMTLAPRISDRRARDRIAGEYARRLGNEWRSSEEAISELDISDQDKAYLRRVMTEGEKNGR
jgi:hypothetical protein